MRSLSTIGIAVLLAGTAHPIHAQAPGELTLYSDIGFRGQAYTLTGPRENITIPFTVRSVRIRSRESWQLCEQSRYRGRCTEVTRDVGNIAWVVRSGRPQDQAVTLPAPVPPGGGDSLRGMASEYFPRPTNAQGRVLSCSNGAAACAVQRADRFCENRGWTRSAYNLQQTVGGRTYLADVLCVRAR